MSLFERMVSLIEEETKNNIIHIQKTIESKHHSSYLIGGSVRDLAMGIKPKDYDITTSMHPEDVKILFKRVFDTGIKHGTVTVLLGNDKFEITTFRKERGYTDGRHPDHIEFGKTLEEDVVRRDFTINSIALDILNKKIIDSQNGLRDIEEKKITTIGNPIDRFTEDGLRPIRCIRFMAGLGFKIDENTYSALNKTKSITGKVSVERFHDEVIKILSFNSPDKGIYELSKLGYFSLFWKIDTKEIILNENENSLTSLVKNPIYFRVAYMIHLLLNEKSFDKNLVSQLLKNLKFSNEIYNLSIFTLSIMSKIKNNLEYLNSLKENPDKFSRFFISGFIQSFGDINLNIHMDGFISLFRLLMGENASQSVNKAFHKIREESPPLKLKDLKINGNSIKIKYPNLDPKEYGAILKNCMELVLNNPELNSESYLLGTIHNN
jgi:poly(A) polymerase/tRNA nucleotidyltransferase (CCA-adding enzyme)